ncbi:restriction endonuclease subunit S [Actinomadura sp. NBRC 104412]|uniref:restriction endonuclease subunit S n=1 Tax=Actinomadura sp. NBRC 104412 TaxID=3032203 RepID=UPI0025531EA0|nr:restriction endonuclease subunit S [Actinomadura sp. NBRC 104412]
MSDLPHGWRWIKLKDCGTWWSGGTPATDDPRLWGGHIPWISAASLKDFKIRDSNRRVTRLGSMAGTKVVDAGNVLFVVRGMSLKSEFRVGVTRRSVAFGQDCKAILPLPSVNGTFLALALKSRERDILAMVDEAGHGTGRLPTDLMARLEVAIPSDANEQRRIAEILDALDDSISAAGDLIAKLDHRLSGLRLAIIDSLFGSDMSRVGDKFEVRAGITLGPSRLPSRRARPYLRVANVQRGRLNLSDVAQLEVSASEDMTYRLRKGDLLVVEGHANPHEIGRCAQVADGAVGLLYQNHLFRLRSGSIIPEFGELWLNSEVAKRYWLRMCATSSGLYTINSEMLTKLPFPDISTQDQLRIVEPISALRAQIEREAEVLARLRLIREGLAANLLSGRVRV